LMMCFGRLLRQFAISACQKCWKIHFRSIDHCSLCWLCCWARYWMLQDMDNMEASCICYVRISMFVHLEQRNTSLLTVTETGIVRLTIQHDLIVRVSFMYYPGDSFEQTSTDILSLEQLPTYRWQLGDFGCHKLQCILSYKQTTMDRHMPYFRAVGNPFNFQLCAAGFILSITRIMAANYSILTCT
jgi:hypothetical protein